MELCCVYTIFFRAGVRFYMRGTDSMGHSANFIETEQILEFEKSGGKPGKKALTSFIQVL